MWDHVALSLFLSFKITGHIIGPFMREIDCKIIYDEPWDALAKISSQRAIFLAVKGIEL